MTKKRVSKAPEDHISNIYVLAVTPDGEANLIDENGHYTKQEALDAIKADLIDQGEDSEECVYVIVAPKDCVKITRKYSYTATDLSDGTISEGEL
jgi:hypothetical protein